MEQPSFSSQVAEIIYSFSRFREMRAVPWLLLWLCSFASLKAAAELLALFLCQGRETMEGRNMTIPSVIYPSCTAYGLEYLSRYQEKVIM